MGNLPPLRRKRMTQEEALDSDTRVTVDEAIREIKAHGHPTSVRIRTFPSKKAESGFVQWIILADQGEVEKIVEITDGTVLSSEVMAWLGY